MCQGFSHFSGFLHQFILAKLATSSIRVKPLESVKIDPREVMEKCTGFVLGNSCTLDNNLEQLKDYHSFPLKSGAGT